MTQERWKRIEELFETAIDLKPGERTAWLDEQCGGDLELRAEVLKLIDADESAPTSIGNVVESAVRAYHHAGSLTGKRIGPYRVLREIGRGGMGTVYLGYRDDDVFHKEVAIKVVQRGMDSEQALERFRHERRILALLDHPNIARVIDGGSTDDGLPYLVMEFIEGQPITQYCDAHELGLRDRILLFRKVCAAVQSAHQNLVVHRDLKPSNIMVDERGEPKLLDFGIAKLVDEGKSLNDTLTGEHSRMLTPKYASPEQVMGEPVTTVSDVYSLGAILYELLTGTAAHKIVTDTPVALMKAICETEVPPPSIAVKTGQLPGLERSQASAKLQGDLDNILLKALAKDRQARYSSVEQFSRDLQRYLDNRPVIARAPTWRYRAGKYLRRNTVAVSAAALIVLTLTGATLFSYYEARRAERRFEQVRRLANVFLFDLHDQIQPLPGSTPVLESSVKVAVDYLDSLAAESTSDRSLQYELATGYQKIGDLQGYPIQPNLNQGDAALASHRKALAIAQELYRNQPERKVARMIALGHHRIAYLMRGRRQSTEAVEEFRKGIVVAEKLYKEDPDDTQNTTVLVSLYSHLGETEAARGREQEALESFSKMKEVAEKFAATNPTPQASLALATSHLRISQSLQRRGDLDGAFRNAESCRALRKAVFMQFPANSSYKREVMNAYERLTDVAANPLLLNLGDLQAALEFGKLHVQFADELLRVDPRNYRGRSDLSIAHAQMCAVLRDGNPHEALQHCRKALELVDNAPGQLWDSYKQRYVLYADVLRAAGDAAEARKILEETLPMVQKAATDDSSRIDIRQEVARTHNYLGSALRDLWELDAAAEQHNKAREILEALTSSQQNLPIYKRDLADTYEMIGAVFTSRAARARSRDEKLQHWVETKKWYAKSLEIWTSWTKVAPTSAMDQSHREKAERAIARCDSAIRELGGL